MKFIPKKYQLQGTLELIKHRNFGLLFDPGLGKTAVVLQAIKALRQAGMIDRVLVIAPRLVCLNTWPQEIEKWDGFKDLSYCQLREPDADLSATIQLCNPDYPRLVKVFDRIKVKCDRFPYDMLVIDESSKFKSPKAKRFKFLKSQLEKFDRRVILTGTFAPNGLMDVFSQIYLLDRGATLGQYVTHFRNRYFEIDNPRFFTYKIRPGAAEQIQEKIAPLVMRLDAAKNLDLPPIVHNKIWLHFPKSKQKKYDGIEKQFFAEINGKNILPLNSGAKYMLCRQLANGIFYGEEKSIEPFHTLKLEALENLIDELQGKPIIVTYVYRSDAVAIKKYFKRELPTIQGGTNQKVAKAFLDAWNERRLPILLAQSATIAHGLNLQGGGNDICFFSLTDHLEDYEQLIRRIYRQGVEGQVRIHYLLTDKTIDRAVMARIEKKEKTERSLLEAIEQYRKGKTDGPDYRK